MSSSSSVELLAPAKLNLFLEVTGRRPDGYHEIDSVFQAIDLYDTLHLEVSETLSLVVSGDAPADASNLVWKAAEALGVRARISLRKEIPPGAGLGGGSSDAAAALLGLDRLYRLGLGPEGLAPVAERLGADVPFFLRGGAARCRGIGERVEPLEGIPGARFLLLSPRLVTPTARVYAALDEIGLTRKPRTATVFLRTYSGRRGPSRPAFFNRLQQAAERLDPRLREVRMEAEREFGLAFTMTGSGSSYFAALGDRDPPRAGGWSAGGVEVDLRLVRAIGSKATRD